MKRIALIASIVVTGLICNEVVAQNGGGMGTPRGGSGGGSGLGGYTEVPEAGRVPYHLFDVILGRPTNTSMTASMVAYEDMEAYLEYGTVLGSYPFKTESIQLGAQQRALYLMEGLSVNTQYYYQVRYKQDGQSNFAVSPHYEFHTPRAFDSDFVFTVQADSHMDENTSAEVYTNSLLGALGQSPDFHLALGDTFMTDKYVDYQQAAPAYLAQRYYFGLLNNSAPLYLAVGNHDAESGNADRMNWATERRNYYIPNPSPNDFYSGNMGKTAEGEPVRNYYAFEWGNSLFVALDPFRYDEGRGGRGPDNWYMTLGKTQYDWLVKTVSESDATFKFVYLHNLVGGAQSNRGGAEASLNFEWGGHEYDGTYTFDEKRPGWGKPIHDVLVENGVDIVFHGHDHMYIEQERDGMVYQLVPQPGHPAGNVNAAEGYGYLSGNIVAGSGYLKVSVGEEEVQVEFFDSRVGKAGQLLDSYVVKADD